MWGRILYYFCIKLLIQTYFPCILLLFIYLLLFIGIYSVGQAAVHPPALVVLSHIVPNSGESIAWVGKGVVYDSGGLSIKSKVSRI